MVPDEFAADEIRAALVLTRRAADAQFWLAHDLLTRLPAVHAAMDAGVLDEPRARVLSDWTTGLDPAAARAVCSELLPRAPGLTTGQLIEQIKKLAVALDPDWARRRYEQALADRKVIGYGNADGSANLSGLNLPVDRVAAACGHIDALAKAVKRAGDLRPIDHIRADLFLGMTDGTYSGLGDAEIIEQVLSGHRPARSQDTGAAYQNDDGAGHAKDASAAVPDSQVGPVLAAVGSGAGMELRVRLSTLLGHDQYPAELAGWGPVHAELARELATALGGAQWRFAITDEQGYLHHCGITQGRPTGIPTRIAACRAIVELAVPLTTLRTLGDQRGELGAWAHVVTDLLHQLNRGTADQDRDSHRRGPGAALRRYLQARDRSCIMIGCRAPARTADQDHTRDHGHGGPTADGNLGAVCRHDHRLKHEGGWRLHQPHPGHFRWISRLGHTYHRPPPPILEPLPGPLPRSRPPLPVPMDVDWEGSEIWTEPPPAPEPEPPPEPESRDDIPPF